MTERETFRFDLDKETDIALVRAKNICYLEIERMSDKKSADANKKELLTILGSIGIRPIDEAEFHDLCDRLTKKADWLFKGTAVDFKKLGKQLTNY